MDWILKGILPVAFYLLFYSFSSDIAVSAAVVLAILFGTYSTTINAQFESKLLLTLLIFLVPLVILFFLYPLPFRTIGIVNQWCILVVSYFGGRWFLLYPTHGLKWYYYLLAGLFLFFAAVSFSYLGNHDFAPIGRSILYLGAGITLGKFPDRSLKKQILLVPPVLAAIVSAIFEPNVFGWLLFGVLPLTAVISFNLGLFLFRKGKFRVLTLLTPTYFALLLLCVFLFFPPIIYQQSIGNGKAYEMPEFHLEGFQGEGLSLEKIKGKVYFLDFWSISCKPCRVQLPIIEEISREFGSDEGVGFGVVSSSAFDNMEEILQSDMYRMYNLPHFFDRQGELVRDLRIKGVPVGILIDSEGVVRYTKTGFHKRDGLYFKRDLIQRIKALRAEAI